LPLRCAHLVTPYRQRRFTWRQEAQEITPCKTVSPLRQDAILSAGAWVLRHHGGPEMEDLK